jgi:hypothetical protein
MKATDRQQMRQPEAAHGLRILLADRSLIAGSERRRDSAGSTGSRVRICNPSRSRAHPAAAVAGLMISTGRSLGPTPPIPEPGIAGKVMAPGQGHWRRRLSRRSKPDGAPLPNPCGVIRRQRNPTSGGRPGVLGSW